MPLDNPATCDASASILAFVVAVFAAIVPSMLLSTLDCGPLEDAGAALGATGNVLVDGTKLGAIFCVGAAAGTAVGICAAGAAGATVGNDDSN